MTVVIDPAFNPIPSLDRTAEITVEITAEVTADIATGITAASEAPSDDSTVAGTANTLARAVFVTAEGDLPDAVRQSRDELAQVGFTGGKGQTHALPGTPLTVLVGTGDGIETAAGLRDAVAAFTRAARESSQLIVPLVTVDDALPPQLAAQVITEGALLARYRYDALRSDPKTVQLERLNIVVGADDNCGATAQAELVDAAAQGVERGRILARTASLARDLANTPPRHLSAVKFGKIAEKIGPRFGLEVEVFDRAQLIELGCGGLLGVNAGSVEEPRMIKLHYAPQGANDQTAHLALVGKGIMYDSGGISLKPSNAMHAAMKLDMMGAAAVFASMTALADLGAQTAVTGWLMCTDNMPSGSATKLGDVLTIRGGTTVEVKNTDAEGRLVLADGLVLATEEERRPDAIVDIATLTGAAMAALGTRTAAMLANNDAIAEQLQAAADASDENTWRLPLDHRYRDQLKSEVADLSNIGGQYAGTILAALFLNEFVDDVPWGHLDIAGTMQAESDDLWRTVGSTGFGARLLAEFAVAFEKPVVEGEG